MKYYSNLKRYNHKGQRVALFGRKFNDGEKEVLEIFELRCSKKDAFNRKTAHQVYNIFLSSGHMIIQVNGTEYHPSVYYITPENEDKPKWSFLRYCNNNYFALRQSYFSYYGRLIPEVAFGANKKGQLLMIKSLVR